jgi:hypothetical protein
MSYNYHEEADDRYCTRCHEPLHWDDDIDVDEETGKAFVSGGDWLCLNPDCIDEPTIAP